MARFFKILKVLVLAPLLLIYQVSDAQNVAINSTGAAPDASAGLDISSTTRGLLIPRMTATDKNNLQNPATGLLIFQTDAPVGFYYNSGTSSLPVWIYNGSGSQWTTSGNNIYYTGGNVAVGTTSTPTYALTVHAASNPLYLSGVQEGSGLDSILLIANGVVKKRVYSATASTTAWALTGNSSQVAAAYNTGKYLGTSDANYLRFRTNNLQRMVIDAGAGGIGGGVGIGLNPTFSTTNPERLIVDIGGTSGTPAASNLYNAVKATGFINNYLQLNVQNKTAGSAASSDIVATADNGSETNYYVDMGINSSNNSSGVFGSFRDAYVYNMGEDFLIGAGTSGKNLKFLTGGTSETANTRMIIDGDGAVGIGTTNTSTGKVSVNAGTGLSLESLTALYMTGGNNGVLQLNIQNQGAGDGTAVSSDIVATASNGTDSTNYINMGINGGDNEDDGSLLSGPNKAYFYANSKNMYIGNAGKDFHLIFFTNSGSASDIDAEGAERMRITAAGQVAIGTTTPFSSAKLTVNGDLRVNSTTYSSDRRLKQNIRQLDYGLKELLQLSPVKYNWIDPTQTTKTHLGLIAQDAKKIIPEIVDGDEAKEMLGIDYTKVVPVMINAIKEQQNQIDALKKNSEKNKARIEAILKELPE